MDDRIRTLKSIKTDEERENYEKYLNRYIIEYKWFINSKNPLDSIREKALQYEDASDARNALESRARLIEIGEYGNALERNITSYLLAIEEYKAKMENRSPYDIIKGILQKDEDTKEYLKNRYMKEKAENSGITLASPVNLNLPSKEDVLTQVFEECDFIGIQKPINALVVVNGENSQMFDKVREVLDECLKENGIDVSNASKNKNTSIANEPVKSHVSSHSRQSSHEKHPDERDEI